MLARSPCHDACEWVTLKQCFPGGRGNTDTTHHHQQQTASLLSAGKQPAVTSLTVTTLWLLNISSGVTAVEFDTTLPSGGRLLRSREAEGIRAMVAVVAAAHQIFPRWPGRWGERGWGFLTGQSGNNVTRPPSFNAQTRAPLSVFQIGLKISSLLPVVIVFGASHYTVWQKQPVSLLCDYPSSSCLLQILPHKH